jgi:mannose-1-phosphate guanylyltransferase
MKIVPVIIAGGAGTRLWPMSSEEKPKQFHNLSGAGTLLEETVKRLRPLSPTKCVIVTAQKYRGISLEETRKGGLEGTVLTEPRPKNTSAAILYAAVYLDRLYDDSVMVVLPADHHIRDNARFASTLGKAIAEAEKGQLVTIGIRPSYPETGYGYIKASENSSGDVLEVESFVEKPDLATAEGYVQSGRYFWNSGMFVWKTSVILEAFRKYLPGMVSAFDPLRSLPAEMIESAEGEIWKSKTEIFNSIESISIDYGIMERASNRSVIPADFGWADLGSWKSTDGVLEPDNEQNRSVDRDNSIFVNSRNCSIFAEGARVAVVGLENAVVVQSGNDILVINKDCSQDVRAVVERIRGRE